MAKGKSSSRAQSRCGSISVGKTPEKGAPTGPIECRAPMKVQVCSSARCQGTRTPHRPAKSKFGNLPDYRCCVCVPSRQVQRLITHANQFRR